MNTSSAIEDPVVDRLLEKTLASAADTEMQDGAAFHEAEDTTIEGEETEGSVMGLHLVISITPERLTDGAYLAASDLRRFNPREDGESNLALLFRLCRELGDGITRAEFRQIFWECSCCENLMFADKRHVHRCNELALLTQEPDLDLAGELNSSAPNPGLSLSDVQRLFIRCHACERVCRECTIYFHNCPVLD